MLLTRAWSVMSTGVPGCSGHCEGLAWDPIPALTGALRTWKPLAHLRGGLFILPSGKSLPRAGLGGFWPVQKDSATWLLTPRCLTLFLSNCHFGNATQPREDRVRSLSLAAFLNKSRGGSCWCPLSSCALCSALPPCQDRNTRASERGWAHCLMI